VQLHFSSSYCVWSCDMGKINVYVKEWLKNRKRENIEITEFFLHISPSNRSFRNGIYSLPSRAAARGSADIIHRMWRISLLCWSGIYIVIDIKKYVTQRIFNTDGQYYSVWSFDMNLFNHNNNSADDYDIVQVNSCGCWIVRLAKPALETLQ